MLVSVPRIWTHLCGVMCSGFVNSRLYSILMFASHSELLTSLNVHFLCIAFFLLFAVSRLYSILMFASHSELLTKGLYFINVYFRVTFH